MARRAAKAHDRRRSRGEIDRNYFFGDILIKEGVAVFFAIATIALFTPFSLQDALRDGMVGYLTVMTLFGLVGVLCFLGGRHLRASATHWDTDGT